LNRRAAWGSAFALLAACAGQPRRATPSPATPAEPAPTAASTSAPNTTSATPSERNAAAPSARRDERQALVDATLKQVAAVRKLPATGPIRSEVIGRGELLGRMKKELLEDLEPELLDGSAELLFALGAAGADLDYLGAMLKLLGTQLAGFYDPREKELVLLDDLGMEAQQATLWHELIHGLQDQHYDLAGRMKWSAGRGDALAAIQSLAEGDATSGMMDIMLLPRGQTALDLPDGVLAGSLGVMEAMPEIASVPRILKRSIVAPYVDGLAFVHALRRAGGWTAVDAAWRDLPTTSEQILHPDKYRTHELAESVASPPPPSADLEHAIYRDVLGEQSLRIAFEEWVPRVTALDAASGWAGDAIAVFATGDRRAVGIHLRYDDEAHARRGFEAIARGALLGEAETWAGDKPPPSVPATAAASALARRSVCQARARRGPFAAVWHGRDLGVALGPYQRAGTVTHSLGDCALALRWAETIAKTP
jgi:hypothetical protein